MSVHHRSAIRQAVVALLAAGGTDAGARVHDTPVDPRSAFPALVVEDGGEQQQPISAARGPAATVRRVLILDITAEVQQVAGYAQQRDTLLGQVEGLMAGAAITGVQSIRPAGYVPDQALGAERPIAVGRQRFELTYITPQGAPGAPF